MTQDNIGFAVGGFIICLSLVYMIAAIYIRKMNEELVKAKKDNEEALTRIISDTYKAGAARMGELVKAKFEEIQKQVDEKNKKPLVFTVATDAVLPDFESRLSIPGIEIPSKDIPILRNHDVATVVGLAMAFIEEGYLKTKIMSLTGDLKEGKLLGWPAIGGKVLESHEEEIEGKTITVIDKFKLLEVSICDQPNADPSIKSFQEQLKDQQS